MNYKHSLSALLVLSVMIFLSCKQQPVDAVYYGQWVNTYIEEYDYRTAATTTLSEKNWPSQLETLPHIMILRGRNNYFKFLKTKSGILAGTIVGKWSIRNNNELTIQTEHQLFYGQIILLNDELSIEGQSYLLDENRQAIRDQAVNQKLKYRRGTKEDIAFIQEILEEYIELESQNR